MQTLYRNSIQSHTTNTRQNVQIGDRVELNIGNTENGCIGKVEYMGHVPTIKHEVIGVNLESAIAEGHDGKGLFFCEPKHGLFTQKQFIKRVIDNRWKSTKLTNNRWDKLSRFPFPDTNFSIILYEHTLIAALWKDTQYRKHGLYKYNILSNQWIQWLNYPSSTMTSWHTMSFSPQKRCIYIYGKQMNLTRIDVTNNTLKTITTSLDTGKLPNSIFINGELHIIGGQNNNKHLIWNGKKKRFEIRHTFTEFEGITGFILVHIKSQNVIALIGGTSYKPFSILDSIYIYFINDAKWVKYNYKLPVPMSNMSCIISGENRYILLIAPTINGLNGSRRTNRIYVIDTTNMNCKQSKIFLPFKPSPCHAVCTQYNKNNTLFICGYGRESGLSAELLDMKEREIGINWIQKIVNYYYIEQREYLHVIQDFEPSHYCIPLSDIIHGELCSIRKH